MAEAVRPLRWQNPQIIWSAGEFQKAKRQDGKRNNMVTAEVTWEEFLFSCNHRMTTVN